MGSLLSCCCSADSDEDLAPAHQGISVTHDIAQMNTPPLPPTAATRWGRREQLDARQRAASAASRIESHHREQHLSHLPASASQAGSLGTAQHTRNESSSASASRAASACTTLHNDITNVTVAPDERKVMLARLRSHQEVVPLPRDSDQAFDDVIDGDTGDVPMNDSRVHLLVM